MTILDEIVLRNDPEEIEAIRSFLESFLGDLPDPETWAIVFAEQFATDDVRRQMAQAVDELRALEAPLLRAAENAQTALAVAEVVGRRIGDAVDGRRDEPPYGLEDFAFEHFLDVSGAAAVADQLRRLVEPLNELI